MKISIQGEPGSFSHEAATKMVEGAEIVPCTLSADVFAALVEGAVEAAVIPIENSLAGSVLEHFDLLLAHDVKVVRETLVRIRHNLIACPGAKTGRDRQRLLSSSGPGPVPALPRGAPTHEGDFVLRYGG